MTDLEIAYPEIVTLIEAYERALFKKMEKDPSDSDVRTAYMANLINMESIMQAHVDASKVSAANVVDGLLSELKNKERQENSNLDIETQTYGLGKSSQKNNDKDPKTWGDYTYSECTVTDINGKEYSVNDPNAPDVFDATWYGDRENNLTEDRWFDGEEIKKKYAARFTNKFEASYSARVTEYLDDKIAGGTGKLKGSNFSIEDCLNCVIRIELDLLVPNLEIVIDFSKLLNQVKQLLQQLLNDLDPTKLFSMICDFFLKFKGNFLCPQNLIGIQLLLPTLFAKFSFDLIKFRFDWTALIGPLIKGILTFLVSLIENIPKITNPIIDCLINSITTVMKALQSIASSIDKGVNEVAGGIEKIVNRVFSIYERILERIYEKTGGKGLIGQFGSISLESDMFKEEYKEFLKENGDVFNQNGEVNPEYFETDLNTEKAKVVDDFISYLKFAYTISPHDLGSSGSDVDGLSFEEITTYFLQWLQEDENYKDFYTVFVNKNQYGSRQQKQKAKKYNDLVKEQTQYQERIKKEIDEEKRDKNKKYFKAGFTIEKNSIKFPAVIGMKPGAKINKYQTVVPYIGIAKTKKLKQGYLLQRGFDEAGTIDKSEYKWTDYLQSKVGLDIKSEYRTSDFLDIPTLNLRKAFDDTVFKFVDERILYYLRIAKSWINESVGNVVKALKALQQFIGEAFDAEFKILGEMQEILQIVRFVRLMIELIDNGLTNCDELRKNKDVFRSILEKSQRNPSNGNYETSNNALTVLDDDEVSNMGLDPEDHIVMVTKDRKYNSVVDLNECADVSKHLEINDYNLDLIYEGIENGTIV